MWAAPTPAQVIIRTLCRQKVFVLDQFDVRDTEYDYSSSGQGAGVAPALWSHTTCVINNLRAFQFTNPAQLHVCRACGITGCESGGWLAFRRLGDALLAIPATAEMSADSRGISEYAPPRPPVQAILIPAATRARLLEEIPGFSRYGDAPALSFDDALEIVRWTAPPSTVAIFPFERRINGDQLVAVSEGELDSAVQALKALFSRSGPAREAEAKTSVTFHVDTPPHFPEWSPLAFDASGSPLLALAPGIFVAPRAE
jgi:hypothetical protein